MHWYMFLQDMLMKLAKAVATAAATLVLKAKNVAQKTEDSAQQNRVIAAATQCALSTSQLVACTRVRKKKHTYTRADHRQSDHLYQLSSAPCFYFMVWVCVVMLHYGFSHLEIISLDSITD